MKEEDKINSTPCLHGGIYSVNPSLVKVDFSSNVNPLGISRLTLHALQENAFSLSSEYPDSECRSLKKKLLDYLENDLDDEWICVGNGATELIHRFAQTFVRKKVIIPFPTFCEYESASKRAGAEIIFILVDESYIELADHGPDSDTMINEIKEFKNLIILRSMTKSFGLAGLRIGYTICNPGLARSLSHNQIP